MTKNRYCGGGRVKDIGRCCENEWLSLFPSGKYRRARSHVSNPRTKSGQVRLILANQQ